MAEKESIIKRTDEAVKTVGAWASFGQILFNSLPYLVVVAGTVGAMLVALQELLSGLIWAHWILIGIALLIPAGLLWLGLAWLWHLRPSANKKSENSGKAQIDLSKSRTFTDQDFAKLSGTLDALKEIQISEASKNASLQEELRYFKTAFPLLAQEAMKDELEGAKKASNDYSQGIMHGLMNSHRDNKSRIKMIEESIHAKSVLNLYRDHLKNLDELGKELAWNKDPVADDFFEDHHAWQNTLETWYSQVSPHVEIRLKSPIDVDAKDISNRIWADWIEDIEDNKLQLAIKQFKIQYDAYKKVRISYIGQLERSAFIFFN